MNRAETSPHEIMIRPIQMRAPTRWRMQIARDFEREVADEEHPGAEAVDRFAELEVAKHLQPGEADVHPVQICRDVAEHDEGQQPPGHLAVGGAFGRGGR